MVEIFGLLKTVNTIANVIGYGGLVFLLPYKYMKSLFDTVNISPILQNILFFLVILTWLVQLCWKVYSKFYLERKERLQAMKEKKERK